MCKNVPATALLVELDEVQRPALGGLYGCSCKVLHLVSLSHLATELLHLLQINRVARGQPGIVAGPAPDGDNHLLLFLVLESLYSFSIVEEYKDGV